ncbi:glycoside hydrolase superfamily [Coemansia spiralis]|nr:glycoside hydrolase superfamily [Coemansia spiralis]
MSNTAASEQRTWDGIQENDSVAWTAVTNYKHASMPIHITAPTTIDDSILAMVQQLTLKEKVGQMTQIQVGQLVDCNGYINKTAVKYWIDEWKVGSFLETPGNHNGRYRWYSAKTFADFTDAVQKIAVECGPKIPVIWGLDSVRGANYVKGAVIFPAGIATAATFNSQFAYDAGRIAAKDTRAAGVHWAFAPVSDLGVNKLWARIYENFGEDPALSSEMTAASVRGYQGDYKHDRSRVAACIKHFIAYGYPFDGADRGNRHVAPHELLEYYVPPFKAAVDAGVASAMESYGVINGEPVVMSHFYLQELLREHLGFRGMLVTDWGEINSQVTVYRTAKDFTQATEASLGRTSIDMSMVADDTSFSETVYELVTSGALPESRIDESVARILQLKKDLGLFEQPFADRSLAETVGSAQDIDAARNAVRESVTLLKNANNMLPLKKTDRVLFVGPTLNSTRFMGGGWNVHWQGPSSEEGDSVYQGFGDTILKGVEQVTGSKPQYFEGTDIDGVEFIGLDGIYAAAKEADKIVIGLGEHTYAEVDGNIGELALPAKQLSLVHQIAAVSKKPIAVVLVQGRPRGLGNVPSVADAVVNAYLPGDYGGLPIAEILYGNVNPSGRLPYTYPGTESQASTTVWQPAYSNYNPLWAFGYGIGYSSMVYSNVSVSSNTLKQGSPVTVSVSITNEGPYPQKEVVMLFTKQDYRFNLAPENNRLRKFTKTEIGVGETNRSSLNWLWRIWLIGALSLRRIFNWMLKPRFKSILTRRKVSLL